MAKDSPEGISTGGTSGSKQRRLSKENLQHKEFVKDLIIHPESPYLFSRHQIKPSSHEVLWRRLSGYDTDYASLIAEKLFSDIARAVLHGSNDPDTELVPAVSYHFEENDPKLKLASRYLREHPLVTDQTGFETLDLNKFAVKKGFHLYRNGTYKKFDTNATAEDIGKYQVVISNDPNDMDPRKLNIARADPRLTTAEREAIKKGIYQDFSLRALGADHDCNPGNMMIRYNPNNPAAKVEVMHIDFGHAFNDLIKGRNPLNHQKPTNHPDRGSTLEFLNRREVNGGLSKLHNYFRGVVPNHAFADQLIEDSSTYNNFNVTAALEKSKTDLNDILKQADPECTDLINKGLHTLNTRINGGPIEEETSLVNGVFEHISEFIEKNNQERRSAGHVMKIQALVEDLTLDNAQAIKVAIEGLYQDEQENKGRYLAKKSPIKGKVEWIRTEEDIRPKGFWKSTEGCKGTLIDYLEHREKQLLEREKSPEKQQVIKDRFAALKKEFDPNYQAKLTLLDKIKNMLGIRTKTPVSYTQATEMGIINQTPTSNKTTNPTIVKAQPGAPAVEFVDKATWVSPNPTPPPGKPPARSNNLL